MRCQYHRGGQCGLLGNNLRVSDHSRMEIMPESESLYCLSNSYLQQEKDCTDHSRLLIMSEL